MNKTLWFYGLVISSLILCPFGPVSAQIPALQDRESGSAKTSLNVPINYPMFPTEKNLARVLSTDCKILGDYTRGQETCTRNYSNGTTLQTVRNYETEGNEGKQQLITTEVDSKGNKLDSKIVRKKIEYSNETEHKTKLKEYFDIVKRPARGKTTRELVVYEYSPETMLLVKSTWTKYVQIRDKAFASLHYHVSLSYDHEGNPLSGFAEKWFNGERVQTLFDWQRGQDKISSLNPPQWQQWHDWIQRASHGELSS